MKRGPKQVPIRSTVKRLLDKEMPVREIAEVLSISTQAVYHHRRKLREAGHGATGTDGRQQ